MMLKYQTLRENSLLLDYNKFTSDIFDAKIKQKELVDKPHISNLAKNSDLNTKLATLATKAELNSQHLLCYS